MHNGPEASNAVASTFPYQIPIEGQCKTALGLPRQFSRPFLIKPLLETIKIGPGASKAVSLYMPLSNTYLKAMQMTPEHPRQFPLHVLTKSL